MESLPDAESTRYEDTSEAEPDPDPSLPDAESTRIEPVPASSTSHESLHPPIEISWGSQLEQFVREQFEGSIVSFKFAMIANDSFFFAFFTGNVQVMSGNYQIHKFDWLKWILTAV